MESVYILVVAILGFLCLTGPDGIIGPKSRH
jgi:hypothetical protein